MCINIVEISCELQQTGSMNNVYFHIVEKWRKHNQQNTEKIRKGNKTLEICEHRVACSEGVSHHVSKSMTLSERETQDGGSENQHTVFKMHCEQLVTRTRVCSNEHKTKCKHHRRCAPETSYEQQHRRRNTSKIFLYRRNANQSRLF